MIRYLLDTNVCVALIRKKSRPVLHRLRLHVVGDLGISAITYAELQFGTAHSADPLRNQVALAGFLAPLAILPFDEAAARRYGAIRAVLESRGKPIGPLDTLIAAHALSLGAILVTANDSEFRRVAGLTVENWER